ncbi:uncharacterized protein LOC131589253 [Poecile atricapillus]|uniref:uncharacterized protein LOC131589253 n=1 Tax=Poecile atricapillus TaxID=48891 RepID=UPI002738F554|nr:uncharacterized protein LOC131589253 [Poecile atricapillus]
MACGMQVACALAADLSNVPAGHAVPASGTQKQTLAEALSALSTLVSRHSCLLFPMQTQQKPQISGAPQPWVCQKLPGDQQQREKPSAEVRRGANRPVWVSNPHRGQRILCRDTYSLRGSQPHSLAQRHIQGVPTPQPGTETHARDPNPTAWHRDTSKGSQPHSLAQRHIQGGPNPLPWHRDTSKGSQPHSLAQRHIQGCPNPLPWHRDTSKGSQPHSLAQRHIQGVPTPQPGTETHPKDPNPTAWPRDPCKGVPTPCPGTETHPRGSQPPALAQRHIQGDPNPTAWYRDTSKGVPTPCPGTDTHPAPWAYRG